MNQFPESRGHNNGKGHHHDTFEHEAARQTGETAEALRLHEDATREKNWKRWGPYLSERQWGTVREDYSEYGSCWEYFSHDQARSRAYRWGEDGLLGICDRQARLCFALALWNGHDPILKERLFGLTGPEGNHGEDCKENYYYLEATPTSSYLKALYKYPKSGYPYARLVEENRRRGKLDPEFELADCGVFDAGDYYDVTVEYAKVHDDDILVRISVENRSNEEALVHLLPTLWFRNTWSWGRNSEGYGDKSTLSALGSSAIAVDSTALGAMVLAFDPEADLGTLLFTENETNTAALYGTPPSSPYTKDAFHRYVVNGEQSAVNPEHTGTKAAAHYQLRVPAHGKAVVRARLKAGTALPTFGAAFDASFAERVAESSQFYAEIVAPGASLDEQRVARQGYAGLLWSKQFYHYVLEHWLEGDPAHPAPPDARKHNARNREWKHVYCRDIISMPDKWEYPWFAAWDLAFHMIPCAKVDPDFAKQQLLLMLREWYMHPNGQMAAYEFALSDVNPPVHAWAVWRVYKMTGKRGSRDRLFLARAFQKLLLNFTWWVNRKDTAGNNLFSGGFLGLDNIGVFDRSQPLPTGGHLDQADGTAWMAFYSSTMMSMALELAQEDPAYEDLASKFFEHFVSIVDAMNTLGGTGLWDEEDGYYYDRLNIAGRESIPLRTRSMVGALPLIAVEILEDRVIDKLPGFKKRMEWFLANRKDLSRHISYMEHTGGSGDGHRLLAVPSRDRLERVLGYLLDEAEFLSPHGLRSLSRVHKDAPYLFRAEGAEYRVEYVPGDSNTGLFGGNSNWRGPVWFPLNYLLIEALERYHHFYGDDLKVECPKGSGVFMNLKEVANELSARLGSIFLADDKGQRPCHGTDPRYASDPHFKELVLFHEYFHGETGQGVGASHQTGWTALAVRCLEAMAERRLDGSVQ
jgi:hypothetical protein